MAVLGRRTCGVWCVVCGVWYAGFDSSPSSSSSLSLLLVFGVVRAQPCEHARYPRTPLCLWLLVPLLFFLCLILSSPLFLFLPRLSSVGMAVCDSPCVGVLCGHDGDG